MRKTIYMSAHDCHVEHSRDISIRTSIEDSSTLAPSPEYAVSADYGSSAAGRSAKGHSSHGCPHVGNRQKTRNSQEYIEKISLRH